MEREDDIAVLVRNFSQNGVNLAGTMNARVFVDDSQLLNNRGGVNVNGAAGAFNFAAMQNTLIDSSAVFAAQVTENTRGKALSHVFDHIGRLRLKNLIISP